jgi:hypothetical protein
MRQQSREHIVILFVGGVLALNYPLLDLFDRAWAPFGIPLLYCYLYLAWLIIIVAADRGGGTFGNPRTGRPAQAPPPRRKRLRRRRIAAAHARIPVAAT